MFIDPSSLFSILGFLGGNTQLFGLLLQLTQGTDLVTILNILKYESRSNPVLLSYKLTNSLRSKLIEVSI
jgi:hypothetical protein